MKYKVYQINFTREQIDEINNSKVRPEYYNLYIDTTFKPFPEKIKAAKHLYKHCADIEADGLEKVFEIGNIGPEDKITRLGPMHSLSVGDVIIDPEGNANYVDMFGFGRVDLL